MAVTFRDYSGDLVEAAHSVLLELVRLLGEYRDDLVVVGGWVPQLILPAEPLKHVGSIDVDLAFNHRNLQDAGYATIQKLLLSRGYEQDHRQPFIFHRTVTVGEIRSRYRSISWPASTRARAKPIELSVYRRVVLAKPVAVILRSTCSSKRRFAANCPEAARIRRWCVFLPSSPSW